VTNGGNSATQDKSIRGGWAAPIDATAGVALVPVVGEAFEAMVEVPTIAAEMMVGKIAFVLAIAAMEL
jgi:hypothetical protein